MSARAWMMLFAVGCMSLLGAWSHRDALRHLGVPLLSSPTERDTAPTTPLGRGQAQAEELFRLPSRITALLAETDGTLWVGTFDQGVWRFGRETGAMPVAVALGGRERFVTSMVQGREGIFVATLGGTLLIDGDGVRRRSLSSRPSEALLSMARPRRGTCPSGGCQEEDDEPMLYAGTAAGLERLNGPGAPALVPLRSDLPLRVTALATSGDLLWLGTPRGVYSAPLAGVLSQREVETRWHPLVFGARALSTNVVMAMAAFESGVLVGTDNGGLAFVDAESSSGLHFEEPRANEVNLGAMGVLADGSVWAGTQGHGWLVVAPRAVPSPLAVMHMDALSTAEVSAACVGSQSLFLGTGDGRVHRVRRSGEGAPVRPSTLQDSGVTSRPPAAASSLLRRSSAG